MWNQARYWRGVVRDVALWNLSCFPIFWDPCLCVELGKFHSFCYNSGFLVSLSLSLWFLFVLGFLLKWVLLVRREKERELVNPSSCLVFVPALSDVLNHAKQCYDDAFTWSFVLWPFFFSSTIREKSVCNFVITLVKVNSTMWALTINFSHRGFSKYRYEGGRRWARELSSPGKLGRVWICLLMGLSLKMQNHHPVALRLHDQMGSKRKYTFIQAHRAWLPKFLLLWILLMALISWCIYSKMDDDTKVRRKEVLGSLCDQRARMLQDQFSVSVNHVHALAILVSTFHYYSYPSAIDQVSAWSSTLILIWHKLS